MYNTGGDSATQGDNCEDLLNRNYGIANKTRMSRIKKSNNNKREDELKGGRGGKGRE